MAAIEKRERKESKVFTESRNKIETLAEFCEVVGEIVGAMQLMQMLRNC